MKASKYLTDYQWVVEADPDKVVTLDFETYWCSKTFSLRKMSMEEYVRDPRFLTHGVGIKLGFKPTRWVAGHDRAKQLLQSIPLNKYTLVAHNAPFDAFVLSDRYGVKPKAVICTMAMAALAYGNNLNSLSLDYLTKRFLPGQVKDKSILIDTDGKRELTAVEMAAMGEYCIGDCDKTFALYQKFLVHLDQTPFNMDLIDLIVRMFSDPTLMLDEPTLNQLLATEIVEKQEALDACVATSAKQLNSNPQFATLLKSLGVVPPLKLNPKGEETYAFAKTDRGLQALLSHEDLRVRQLVKSRLRVKTSINETRAKKYLEVESRGTWPVHLNVSGARTTHRLSGGSGGGGNPQNLGKKSPLRFAILPPPGHRLFAIDSSNIELRINMALAGETEVVERLRDPTFDLYSVFGSTIYNCALEQVHKNSTERGVGKVACLQLQFGSGAPTFRDMAWNWGLELEPEEAARICALYRASFPKVKEKWGLMNRIISMLQRGEEESTWFDHLVRPIVNGPGGQPALLLGETGTYITYPNLRKEYNEKKQRMGLVYDTYDKDSRRTVVADIYGAKAWENVIQALARNVVLEQTVALDTFLREEVSFKCRTVMSVHDESIHLVPEDADHTLAMEGALEIYSTAPAWWPDLPVFGEGAWGDTYGDAK